MTSSWVMRDQSGDTAGRGRRAGWRGSRVAIWNKPATTEEKDRVFKQEQVSGDNRRDEQE
ncbi:Hypothetical protein SMAX5B_004918, partial [Scophthalmus maximus]